MTAEKVQCVSCSRFTLQPRTTEEVGEQLRELDLDYASIGWGRCELYRDFSRKWFPSDTWRECDRHKMLDHELVALRRDWITSRTTQSATE